MKNDEFGARMKEYEARETGRKFLPYIPVYARIDGRSFSKFTKKANRPFDDSITEAMHAATRALIEQTGATIGYTQSDEISLVWEVTEPGEAMMFDGKVQKMTSVLAGIATAAFMRSLFNDDVWNANHPNWMNKMPHFDARVIQLPNRTEAANMFLWRESDARKNAITMVASSLFSHKELHGKSGKEKLKMIESKDVDFDSFPVHNRRGAFMRRETFPMVMSEELRMSIPEKSRPEKGVEVTRSRIEIIEMPPFNAVFNRERVIFDGHWPDSDRHSLPGDIS